MTKPDISGLLVISIHYRTVLRYLAAPKLETDFSHAALISTVFYMLVFNEQMNPRKKLVEQVIASVKEKGWNPNWQNELAFERQGTTLRMPSTMVY